MSSDSTSQNDNVQLEPKRCPQCKETYPRTAEYWQRNRARYDGLNNYCKKCHNKNTKALHQKDPEKQRQRCRRYEKTHRQERNAEARRQRIINPEKMRQPGRRYYQANKEQRLKDSRDYHKANRQRLTQRARHYNQARRARKAGAAGFHTSEQVKALYADQCGLCFHCGCDLTVSGYHEDHWTPLVRKGSDWISNIRLLCPPCNLSKGAKLPHEWCPEKYPPPD